MRENEEICKRVVDELRGSLERKDHFLAMLAHEMRSPLAPIANALELLARRADDAVTVSDARALIARQVKQLTRLVDDLFDLECSIHGTICLRRERVDLADVALAAIETAQPLINARRHSLVCTAPPGVAIVDGDPGRLTQLVANLLLNAAKFTEPGGFVGLALEVEPAWALVKVRDSGAGIDAELLPQIFDLFVQGSGGAGPAKSGMGLGLALARCLADLHGGTLTAQSGGVGQGSEFTLRLPAVPARALDALPVRGSGSVVGGVLPSRE